MEIYDSIGMAYKNSRYNIKRRASSDYTFLRCVGDVRGKSILDLGCGDGNHTRTLKRAGATEVVGVDISEKMTGFAMDEERRSPSGIKYECHDVAMLPEIGKFDIVLGAFILHYSRTKEELFGMCRNACCNIKNGGKFVGINIDPVNPLQLDARYGSTITCEGSLKEGCVIKVVLYEDNKPACAFDNYHWNKATYEEAFSAAGFKDLKWNRIEVSKEGIDKFGPRFWEQYLKQSGLIVFECNKQKI